LELLANQYRNLKEIIGKIYQENMLKPQQKVRSFAIGKILQLIPSGILEVVQPAIPS